MYKITNNKKEYEEYFVTSSFERAKDYIYNFLLSAYLQDTEKIKTLSLRKVAGIMNFYAARFDKLDTLTDAQMQNSFIAFSNYNNEVVKIECV